jgi:hypothetical protein
MGLPSGASAIWTSKRRTTEVRFFGKMMLEITSLDLLSPRDLSARTVTLSRASVGLREGSFLAPWRILALRLFCHKLKCFCIEKAALGERIRTGKVLRCRSVEQLVE